MPKFKVRIVGRNYRIGSAKRTLFLKRQTEWKTAGFYTTRFIETDTANTAISEVMTLLEMELESDGRKTAEGTMELDEIEVNEEAYDLYAPGSGYTFFVDDETVTL